MTTTPYVAFLRGINVGGNNIIKMAELKACLIEVGFEQVSTYIQSGNVLFSGPATDSKQLSHKLSAALKNRFAYSAPITVRTLAQMKAIVQDAPAYFDRDDYRCDVIYLIDPLTPQEVLAAISLKEGVDRTALGSNVVYFARLTEKAAQSRLTRIISTPIYQNMTIRNWNTTKKLLTLMEAMEGNIKTAR